jgi:hypothetical protein
MVNPTHRHQAMPFVYHNDRTLPEDGDWIFVFGSNLAGRHGAGAAKVARDKFGAQYGVGRGITGNAYAIPTKDEDFNVRSLSDIASSVERFAYYVHEDYKPDHSFWMTRIGCGLAGYDDSQIAPLFAEYFRGDEPVSWPIEWKRYLEE